ncbi:class I SAM-dependent methyltransferase [Luteibacter sp.]|uniref:class I SAM-dependent methyltransferase n=1 Tax=Luteibacter sp. TaxID=1886636 RepID=UPI003F81C024
MTTPLALALRLLAEHGDARPWLAKARDDGSVMAAALLGATEGADAHGAYDQPRAFEVFIRAGGNPPLYGAVSAALARLYEQLAPRCLLDIGVGDGMALLPALGQTRHVPATVDVVEPSGGLLDALRPRLPKGKAWQLTLQAFLAQLAPERRWDLAQSTFALQSIPPGERLAALKRLRRHATRLAIVEFDVPAFANAEERFLSLATRYEGVAREYGDDAPLVSGGFLAPMLLGQLRATAPSNWEQPISAWQEELTRAGYRVASTSHIHDYSWAPAWLIVAKA